MRIVSVIASADWAGAEVHVEHVARYVAGEHVIIALAEGPMLDRWRATGAEVLVLPAPGKFPWTATMVLARRLVDLRPDVVHAHTPKANLLTAIALTRGGLRGRVPFVMTVHGSHRQFASARLIPSRVYRWADLWAASIASAVVAVCESDRRELVAAGFPETRLEVIANGVPDQSDFPRRFSPEAPRSVVWAGRFSAEKRPLLALSVAAHLGHHPRLAAFRLVGDGPRRALLVRRASMGDVRVESSRPGLASLWADTDVLLNTSSTEGLSLAILEALAAGVPVVATRVGGNPEAVGDGGVLIPDGGRSESALAAELAAVIRGLIEDDVAYAAAAQAARARYEARFRVETMATLLTALYARLGAHSGGA